MTTSKLPVGPVSLRLAAGSNGGERSAENLGDLLDQVSKNSIGEIDNLLGEFRRLRGKLEADGVRIKRDIEEYQALSEQVMQLASIISNSVATLSTVQTPTLKG
jgi:hypothetical protein